MVNSPDSMIGKRHSNPKCVTENLGSSMRPKGPNCFRFLTTSPLVASDPLPWIFCISSCIYLRVSTYLTRFPLPIKIWLHRVLDRRCIPDG